MNGIKLLLRTIYSKEAIFELLDTKIIKSILVYLFYCLILNFALAFNIINLQTISPTLLSKTIYQDISLDVISKLPDCRVKANSLLCANNEGMIISLRDYEVVINRLENENINKSRIVFNKDNIVLVNNDRTLKLNYNHFNDFHFNQYEYPDAFINDISNRLFLTIKPYILFPLLTSVYCIVILFDFVFVFALALSGMLFNFGGKRKLHFKESLNLAVYSSLLPTIISLIISLFISPVFGVVIYNFLLALFFIYNYKKLIKGNFSKEDLLY